MLAGTVVDRLVAAGRPSSHHGFSAHLRCVPRLMKDRWGHRNAQLQPLPSIPSVSRTSIPVGQGLRWYAEHQKPREEEPGDDCVTTTATDDRDLRSGPGPPCRGHPGGRGDERLVPRLRAVGHHLTSNPRCAGRPQAGAAPGAVVDAADGAAARHPLPEVGPRGRRHHGPLPPPRRRRHLRHPRAHGPGLQPHGDAGGPAGQFRKP